MIEKKIRIHFVGVGGVGMCGLAEWLHLDGHRISGSDRQQGAITQRLANMGIKISSGHGAENVASAECVVASSAIPSDNPELREAHERGIPVVQRGQMLAEIMQTRSGIAIGGSHGKTTTTSLVDHILHASGLDPTSFVGGRVLGTSEDFFGLRRGQGPWLIAEADESDGSFLHLSPKIAVITNIDAEHLDHYGSLRALEDAFITFAERIPSSGRVIACLDHPGVRSIAPRITPPLTTYGFHSPADLTASNLMKSGPGVGFNVHYRGEPLGSMESPLPGEHNVLNTLAALAVSLELGISFESAAKSLLTFGGVERRFQLRGRVAGIRIVDDYAHHPAELRSVLATARSEHSGRIIGIFQPHRYTRTRDCLAEFARAFDDSDRLIVTEIYAAGDEVIPGITGQLVADQVIAHGHADVRFVAELDAIASELARELEPGDLVLTLGAGDISGLAEKLLQELTSEDFEMKKGRP